MSFMQVEYEVLKRIAAENDLHIVEYIERIDDILEERQQQVVNVECEGSKVNITRIKIFVRNHIKSDIIKDRPAIAPITRPEAMIAIRILMDLRDYSGAA